MAITKEQFDKLGLQLFYRPASAGYPEEYSAGNPKTGILHKLDSSTAQYLKGLGAGVKTIGTTESTGPGSQYKSTGGNTIDMSYLDNAAKHQADEEALAKQREKDKQLPEGYVQGPKTAENTAGWYTKQEYDQKFGDANVEGSNAWHEAEVAAGREVKVPVGNGFGYLPKGSAGEANMPNIGTHNTANAANAGLPAVQGGGAPAGQINIGTAQAPAYVPEGSPAHVEYLRRTGGGGTGGATGAGGAGTTGAPGGTGTGTGMGAAGTMTNEQMRANLAAILPADVIATIPDNQLAAFSAIADNFKQQYTLGTVNADIQAKDLQDAINSVAGDIEFQAKYGDNLKLATADFQNSLQDFQFQTGQLQTQQQQQFQDQQKALAEEKAAMGQTYSGFRNQAKQRLATDQGGIIESTRQQLKKSLTNLGQAWEGTFGSAAAQTPSVDYVNPLTGQLEKQQYSPLGNIYGSVPLAKKQEMDSLGAQRYNAVKLPI